MRPGEPAQPQRGVEAWAWRLLGEIGAHLASPDVAGARAAEHLIVAADLYRELDMPFWLERTGRAGRVE